MSVGIIVDRRFVNGGDFFINRVFLPVFEKNSRRANLFRAFQCRHTTANVEDVKRNHSRDQKQGRLQLLTPLSAWHRS